MVTMVSAYVLMQPTVIVEDTNNSRIWHKGRAAILCL